MIQVLRDSDRRVMALWIAVMATLFLIWSAPVLAQQFLMGSEDIPLASGLNQVEGAGLVFDSPSGRIVETFVSGSVMRSDVLAFYNQSLPALGWEMDPSIPNAYLREGERLTLDFFGEDGALSIRFTLAPS